MKSPFEASPQPEKSNKPETVPADPLARLKEALERKEKLEEPKTQPMSVGRMEELQEFLEHSDAETFLGRVPKIAVYPYVSRESVEKKVQHEQELIDEFLSAKDNLDSNTKKKMWKRIREGILVKKLEEGMAELDEELRELERIREKSKVLSQLPAEEKAELKQSLRKLPIYKRLELLQDGVEKIDKRGFYDLTQLNHVRERIKKVKKLS